MNRLALALFAPFACGFALVACGGVTGIDDVFGNGGAGGATSGTGGSHATTGATTGQGGAGGAVTSGPTTTGPTTTGPGATGPGATGPGATGPGATGPGATGPGATGPGATTSSGGGTGMVFCNNGPCAQGEICCFNTTMPSDHCGQAGTCGDGYIELGCNGAEDCNGGICCADVDFQNQQQPYLGISCQQSCDGQNHLVMCNDQNQCQPGQQCKQSQILGQGFKYCN